MPYERLAAKLENATAIRSHSKNKAEEAWISEVEEELGLRLPPSYRWWLQNFGSAWLIGAHILSVGPPEHREYNDSDLIYYHRLNIEDADWREQFPHRLDLFVPDSDELYFFDTSAPDENGEFPVMCYDLMNGIIDVCAPTFADFLEMLIDERRSERQ